MAICPNCGSDNRDGVWTCAACGEPMAAGGGQPAGGGYDEAPRDHDYYNAPTAYGTSAPHIPPLSEAKKWGGGGSPLLKIVLIVAAIAVIGIVLAWFFLLRGGGGDAFIGTWRAAEGNDKTTMKIERNGGDFHLTFTDTKGESAGPFKAELDGDELKTTLEYDGDDETDKAAADIFRAFATAMIDDFAMVFEADGDGLVLRVEGSPKAGVETGEIDQETRLERVD